MQKILSNNKNKKGFVVIMVCVFVPVIILATQLCTKKSDAESRTIKNKFKMVECFLTGVTEGSGTAYVNLNDRTGNASHIIKKHDLDFDAPKDGSGIATITAEHPAYITLTVQSTIEAEGKISFSRGEGAHSVAGMDKGSLGITKVVDTSVHTIKTTQEFNFGRQYFDCHSAALDKLHFKLEGTKIDSILLGGSFMELDWGWCESTPGYLTYGHSTLRKASDGWYYEYSDYENWSGHIYMLVKGNFTINTCDSTYTGNFENYENYTLQVPTAKSEILSKITGNFDIGNTQLFNDKVQTINRGVKIIYDEGTDETQGRIEFSGTGDLFVTVSPVSHNSYIKYIDTEEQPQNYIIAPGTTQTIVISPSTHYYKKLENGTYQVQLDLRDVKILKAECPQVFVGQ